MNEGWGLEWLHEDERPIRSTVRHFGVELRRYPQCDPSFQGIALLNRNNVEVVLDVGANLGQYAMDLRRFGYTGRIMSFEPVKACFDRLLATSANDYDWTAHRIALVQLPLYRR